MIIKPLIRRNVCINAHPLRCAAQVRAQINYVMVREKIVGPLKVQVIGASNGFGIPGGDYSQDVRPDLF
jgi:enoyl-[acyl-carrier protein] reductase/trans-2-enoyl-CoA reductase (NAD+)